MVLEVIDVFQLEGGHACFPDDLSRGCPELYILWCDDGVGEIGGKVFLGQHLVRKIQVILIDKAPVKALPFLVEIVITVVRQDLVLQVLFHNTKGCADIRFFWSLFRPERLDPPGWK
jgi:hypothetical protein